MKKLITVLLMPLLLAQATPLLAAVAYQEAAKNIQQTQDAVTVLSNRDVLELVKSNLATDVIVAKIKASDCDFDTTPAALQQMKTDGVPDAVLLAMVMAPKRGTTKSLAAEAIGVAKKVKVKIPFGTVVEVESAFTVSSQEVKEGDLISFRVVYPVMTDGVTVIAEGTTVTARVVKASRGGHFGRAGRLAWTMEYVTAVDGTRIPLQAPGRLVGDSKAAKVAAQTILTGAALWFIAPVALLHGFKRGENAILPAGKRFAVIVQEGAEVNVPVSTKQ
ncbi:MAG TPA: hypothetical protein VF658_03150 [Pyrinomonadaceae bacterium]|jgi:predicted metal-binding protein